MSEMELGSRDDVVNKGRHRTYPQEAFILGERHGST